MRELWNFLHVKAFIWYHGCVCQQVRVSGIWDSNNGVDHSITVTWEATFHKKNLNNRGWITSRSRWPFSTQNTVCGTVEPQKFLVRLFSTASPNSCQMQKRVSVFAFVSVFLFRVGLILLCPLFSPSLHSVLMVPGYSQVSGERKDLFCCFGSPVSLGSQGTGWGSSTTHLCLGQVWLLMWPCSAPLLCPAIWVFSTLCGMTFVSFHLKTFPFALWLFLFPGQHSDYNCPTPMHPTYVHIRVQTTKD